MPLLGVAAATLLVAGCGTDAPAGPAAASAPADVAAAATAGIARPMSPLAIARAGVDDAVTRILPSLSATRTGVELRGPLHDLAAQLAAGDGPRARRALARARDAVSVGDAGDAGDAPDLAAIGLVLDHAATLLDDGVATAAP